MIDLIKKGIQEEREDVEANEIPSTKAKDKATKKALKFLVSGDEEYRNCNLKKAISSYNKGIEENCEDSTINEYLLGGRKAAISVIVRIGDESYQRGKFEEAEKFYLTGIGEKREDEDKRLKRELHRKRAEALLETGKFRDSLKETQKALQLLPTDKLVLQAGAKANIELGFYTKAIALCNKGLQLVHSDKDLLALKEDATSRFFKALLLTGTEEGERWTYRTYLLSTIKNRDGKVIFNQCFENTPRTNHAEVNLLNDSNFNEIVMGNSNISIVMTLSYSPCRDCAGKLISFYERHKRDIIDFIIQFSRCYYNLRGPGEIPDLMKAGVTLRAMSEDLWRESGIDFETIFPLEHEHLKKIVEKRDRKSKSCLENGLNSYFAKLTLNDDDDNDVNSEDDDDEDDDDEDDDDEDDDDDDDDDDGDGEDDEGDEEKDIKGYELRKRRMIPNRYIAPPLKSNEKGKRRFHMNVEPRKRGKKTSQYASPVRRVRRPKRKAHHMSSSTSSSDDSDNEKDERKFERRKARSMAKARGRCLPMNFTMDDAASGILKERARIGSSLADVDPMSIDCRVMFDAVGGLSKQIRALKEMVLFPLMYPEVFEKFKIAPPRGVLFHGPPGTGKTLVARALANECSQGDKKVAFFMRKGADCLSKWVGESERQLRLLFDQAFSMRPAIIFFDEIDGLAPVRSSRQDQIHSSIVSTLLALMDGLDSRGEIVVIGATNRIDAIDPALRRPGRFDREFQFALPDKNARRSILTIHTRDWEPKLLPSFVSKVADHCVGYCGADIKALCAEAALFALRRRYPQIYSSTRKLLLDVNSIEVTAKDFQKAMTTIIPASQRSVVSPARALSPNMWPLLKKTLTQALEILQKTFPPAHIKTVTESSPSSLMGNSSCSNNSSRNDQQSRMVAILSDEEASSDEDLGPPIFESLPGSSRSERYLRRIQQNSHNVESMEVCHSSFFSWTDGQNKRMSTYRPRLLICGNQGMGQSTHVAPALLHAMEHMTVHCLDLPGLYGVVSKTPEEACSQLFREARRTTPCIVYSPHFDALWNATGDSLHATLLSLLQDLPPLVPLLFLVTADHHWSCLPSIMKELFSAETGQVFQVANVTSDERRAFFHSLFLEEAVLQPKCKKSGKNKIVEVLQFAPTPPPPQLSEAELQKARQDEENTMRELRIFLRDVTSKLFQDRRFKEFTKPVDLIEVPDYLEVIDEPMDLTTILQKINCHQYSTCAQYLADVDLITSNALKYNPDRDPMDKLIRHRACELSDVAHSEIKSQLEPEFEKTCEEIIASRERRGDKSTAAAPAFVFTAPLKQQTATEDQVEKAVLGVSDITFISESQSQSNSKRQKKKPRRKKAPIYWGKKPSKRKADVKRKLDSELDQVTQEIQIEVNGEQAEVSGEALPEDFGERSTNEESEQDPGVISDKEGDVANQEEDDEDEEDYVELMENGVASIDGDVVLLDSDNLTAEIKSGKLNSGSILQSRLVSTERPLENHELLEGFSSLQNGVTPSTCLEDIAAECESDKEPAGEDSSNSPLEKEQNKFADCTSRGSAAFSEDIKEKLATLLDLLVHATKGASIEMLEGYHNSLQCCIYKQRHNSDKRQLLKDLELMIKGFGQSSRTV